MSNSLFAISPVDGRYATITAPLREFASESALIRARVRVEIEYVIALSDLEAIPVELDEADRSVCRACYNDFTDTDAELVKQIETEGYKDYDATNHDVKAVEYFIRETLPADLDDLHPWIHFGLTSEDVTNLAYRLCIRSTITELLLPTLMEIREELGEMATRYRNTPMLARTHGQPATPTTFGKELAVYADRLDRNLDRIRYAETNLSGKLAGASGTYAAHVAAYPAVDWRTFAREFIEELGFTPLQVTTQINPGDDLAELFGAFNRLNQVLLDLAQDAWLYISFRYLGQRPTDGETGSSTMPHKVNPIDFENAEGNLGKANSDLTFLADWITSSRLQRDLTDSTVKRNIGVAFAHCLIAYTKLSAGLSKVVPNPSVMQADLADTPEVITEAIQTILRREGHADAYEMIKTLTRGKQLSLDELRDAIQTLDVTPSVQRELLELTPIEYTGLAMDLVDEYDN